MRRMKILFGDKLNLNYPSEVLDELYSTWATELSEFPVEQIRTIWPMIKDKQFPPSLSDVISWLKPKIHYEQLFIEAARGEFYFKAVFEAAQQYGQYDIRRDNYDKAKARWKTILDQCFLNYGKEIYMPPPMIEHKEYVKPEKDDSIEAMRNQIYEQLNRKRQPNKDWAYKLLEAYKNGESLCEAQIQSVSEALGIEPNVLRHSRKPVKPAQNESVPPSRKDRVIVD